MASICGWSEIASCACQAGRCIDASEATEQIPQPVETAIWPASNFDVWPTIRIVALVAMVCCFCSRSSSSPRFRAVAALSVIRSSRGSVLLGTPSSAVLPSAASAASGGTFSHASGGCDAGPYDGHGVRIGALCVCVFAPGPGRVRMLTAPPTVAEDVDQGREDSWEAMDGVEVELNSS